MESILGLMIIFGIIWGVWYIMHRDDTKIPAESKNPVAFFLKIWRSNILAKIFIVLIGMGIMGNTFGKSMEDLPAVVICLGLVFLLYKMFTKRSKLPPAERMRYEKELKWGLPNPAYICPHCQTKGRVFTKSVKRKKGVSGAKATGAVLTGGLSLLATGLSRKEGLTQAHCCNCDCSWDF